MKDGALKQILKTSVLSNAYVAYYACPLQTWSVIFTINVANISAASAYFYLSMTPVGQSPSDSYAIAYGTLVPANSVWTWTGGSEGLFMMSPYDTIHAKCNVNSTLVLSVLAKEFAS